MAKNTSYKVLVVDDEPDILDFVAYNLRKERFEVFTATNGRAGLEMAFEIKPDVIILDVMMPGMDGMEVCSEIRLHREMDDTLIAFLTARSEDYSQIAGFNVGADDYITKPIRPNVLVSRIQAMLRRIKIQDAPESIVKQAISSLEIDLDAYAVRKDGREIPVTRKEFQLLSMLSSRPNVVFRREYIFKTIWGDHSLASDRTIDVHVRKIREKTGCENLITVKGVGYKWVI